MEDVKFCLVFPREALSVPVMRHVLGETLRGLGADDDGIADLLLAVTEACTNVLRHGGPGRRYEVMASVGAGGCLVEVLNTGRVFDAHGVPGVRLRRGLWPAVPAVIRVRRRPARPPARAWRDRRPWRPARVMTDDALAALPETGRGLAIMRACVDDVTLRSAPESGTVVSLQKRFAWRSDAPLARLPAGELRDAG